MSRKNKSYPAELKYQAVADYLSGAGSLRAICKKYKIGNKKRLQDWIKLYNSHKELKCYTGGSRMTKGRDTTYEERIAFVKECIENGYNYTEISEKYKGGYQQIYTLLSTINITVPSSDICRTMTGRVSSPASLAAYWRRCPEMIS